MLNCDGWQYATAYHRIIRDAADGRFVCVMPDVTDDNGEVQMYSRAYDERLWSLVDARPTVRALGFAAFAKVAHRRAAELRR